MARLRTAKDGHPYLTHGYPVLDQFGQLDVRFSTYQLYDTAESLLREAGLQEGASLTEQADPKLVAATIVQQTLLAIRKESTRVPSTDR
jgi:hypothetical protein